MTIGTIGVIGAILTMVGMLIYKMLTDSTPEDIPKPRITGHVIIAVAIVAAAFLVIYAPEVRDFLAGRF